jgi:uncharacterized protein YhaN
MRFESLSIEKYGLIESRTFSFPASPGLILIYGPNEAGKSTSLEAISDFLFGVPDRTARGQVFGYESIRLSATLALADGRRLSLKRRKGKSRTLVDAEGQAVDDAILNHVLGSTGRDRFGSLFGLDHLSLRSGGEHLLAAEGDIGRLILEAGGGLRALVDIIDKLGAQAAGLFDSRRKGDRAFYIGLAAFEAADQAVKEGLLTREAFEETRRRREVAVAAVDALRLRTREIKQEILRLGRLVRVVPIIREHDRVGRDLSAFADLPCLSDGFAEACDAALGNAETAMTGLGEAESRCAALRARIEAITLPAAILNAEAAIRDVADRAVHVRKAREDRPRRDLELAALDDKLKTVRGGVGLSDDLALEEAAPPADAITAVQTLAAQGLARRGEIKGLAEERVRETRLLDAISARQDQRRVSGAHAPFGVNPGDFADIAIVSAAAETKARQAARAKSGIDVEIIRLGFADIDQLIGWNCPDPGVIQSEIERRGFIGAEQTRVLERIASETERLDAAAAETERFMLGPEPPSDAAIMRVRNERDRIWDEIKARYLSAAGEAVAGRPLAERMDDVERQQVSGRQADDLADRKSIEAKRVAALDQARCQVSTSAAAVAALSQQRVGLAEQLTSAADAWAKAWPQASARAPDLGRLKTLASERASVMIQYAAWRSQADEAEAQAAQIVPRLAALFQAEATLGLPAEGALAARVGAAARGIKIHEDAYADYRRDDAAFSDLRIKLDAIAHRESVLAGAEADWQALWRVAAHALGLDDAVALERANEIATQWATAAGLLDGARTTRRRLQRMDDDESALRAAVQGVAATMDFSLPDDAVVAAKMLVDRLETARETKIEHDSLGQLLTEAFAERDDKRKLAEIARDAVEALCRESATTPAMLSALAGRCRQRSAALDQLKSLEDAIGRTGDGLPIEELRLQWADRDLDAIQASLDQSEGELVTLEDTSEGARAGLQERTRELMLLSTAEGVNKAVADRERATAEIHGVLENYIEIALAEELLRAAMDRVREQLKDPLIARAGTLFQEVTAGAFAGIETEIDDKGHPVVVGRRSSGGRVPVAVMSDGVRDQLFLAFRIASIEQYCQASEPLPFIADDVLVHFDDPRGASALRLLAELGKTTQVLAFTHHRHVRDAVLAMAGDDLAAVIELDA